MRSRTDSKQELNRRHKREKKKFIHRHCRTGSRNNYKGWAKFNEGGREDETGPKSTFKTTNLD